MFIGDTETPNHLATEVIDNMFDEIVNGYGTKGTILIREDDGSFWVSDDGRGIPVTTMELPDGVKEDSIKVLCTRLFSGSKFDLDDYNQLLGMHGVGLVAVNALSEWMTIRTRDRKNKNIVHVYIFKNSELVGKQSITDKNQQYSTIVGFKPNEEYFDFIEFDKRALVERLVLAKAILGCEFEINKNPIPNIDLETYVRQTSHLADDDPLFEYQYVSQGGVGRAHAFITYAKQQDTSVLGSVNLRSCTGTYLTSFQTLLKKILQKNIGKTYKDLPEKDLLTGLRLYICLNIPEPKFDSQAKSNMILNVKKSLLEPLADLITSSDISRLVAILEQNLDEKYHKKATKGTIKGKKVQSDFLRDCLNTPGDVLYILEGESADGTLKKIRDERTEASFTLSGKVLNVESATVDKIEKSKKIQDLLKAIGPKGNRRYKKIKILADADPDGAHIVVLSTLILQKFIPDMIQNGDVSVVLPPLYGAEKGKQYVPIYNHTKVDELRNKGFEIIRFKGLGEMDAEQLEVCLKSNVEYIVTWPSDELHKNLIKMITTTDIKRAIMNDSRCTFDTILQKTISDSNTL